MSGHHRWLQANNVTGKELFEALSLLSNPGGTRPSGRAVRKMIGRLRRGDKPRENLGWSPWREAPRIKFAGEADVL